MAIPIWRGNLAFKEPGTTVHPADMPLSRRRIYGASMSNALGISSLAIVLLASELTLAIKHSWFKWVLAAVAIMGTTAFALFVILALLIFYKGKPARMIPPVLREWMNP
jgi:hypothetical protein